MNILVITMYYPQPDRKDLIQNTSAIHYIAREWVKQGHDVTVLHGYGHYFHELVLEFGRHDFRTYERVQKCPDNEGVRVLLTENQYWIRNSKWFLPIQQKRIAEVLNAYFHDKLPDYKPDVILVHFPTNFKGIVERLNFSCPRAAVFHKTDYLTICQHPKVVKNMQATYGALGTRTLQMRKKLNVLGVETKFLAQSGIDESIILSREAVEAKWSTAPDVWKITYAGKLIPEKNVDTVLKAIAAVKTSIPVELTVIGDGKRMKSCRSLAKRLGIEEICHFTGRLSRAETIAKFRETRIFVMVSRLETLGLVYLEAMSQGCLAIGSRSEGIDGIIVNGENGYLSESGNADELAAILKNIANNSAQENRRLALNGLETIQNMTSCITAERYLHDALACSMGENDEEEH